MSVEFIYDKQIFHKIGEVVKKTAEDTMKYAVQVAKTKADVLVPVDTSRLKGSIFARTAVEGDNIEGIVGSNMPYAPYVEYGTGIYAKEGKGRQTPWVYFSDKLKKFFRTRGMLPQPYLFPAVNYAQQNLGKWLKERIAKIKIIK
jgi:hypothetical protein